jgi:hypothetical protein
MQITRRQFVLAFLTTFALAACVFAPRSLAHVLGDPFEGKWKVKVEPDEDSRKTGEKDYDDTFTFKANKFTSEACKKKGFGEVAYDEDTRRFGPATFTAESKSEKEGTAKWSGTVTVNEMTGELTITKKDGSTVHYTFKGSKS